MGLSFGDFAWKKPEGFASIDNSSPFCDNINSYILGDQSTMECVTQLYGARAGEVTPAMREVARRENVDAEFVRAEVARGRMVIPANIRHGSLKPIGIGINAKCKVNANIGRSPDRSDAAAELEKLAVCLKYGADTVMDLSTGEDLDEIRQRIIEASPIPVGTVPIYQLSLIHI